MAGPEPNKICFPISVPLVIVQVVEIFGLASMGKLTKPGNRPPIKTKNSEKIIIIIGRLIFALVANLKNIRISIAIAKPNQSNCELRTIKPNVISAAPDQRMIFWRLENSKPIKLVIIITKPKVIKIPH